MPSEIKRKLAAFVFTEIVGFTALSAKDEKKAIQLLDSQRHKQNINIYDIESGNINNSYLPLWEIGKGWVGDPINISDSTMCIIVEIAGIIYAINPNVEW